MDLEKLHASSQLNQLVKRYVWWETPDWAYAHPKVFLANIMNLGSWNDIQALRKVLGDEPLKITLQDAPIGYFNYRAWDYWHVKFNILPIPPLPKREL